MQVLRTLIVATLLLTAVACGPKRPAVLVGQTGVVAAQAIDNVRAATNALQQGNVITPQQALSVQESLLKLNDKLKPVPELLRTIDRLDKANKSTTDEVDRAINILQVVGQDLSITIAGVPVSAATSGLIETIRSAQQTVQTVLIELAKMKGAR